MILSHKHKFIFLKTKNTAGTSLELALSTLCGDEDVITPLSEIDERHRSDGRGAQNWRQHSWWQSPRPFWKRRMLKVAAQDYGFYNHMTAAAAKALINDDDVWRSYFKFAFERNPWDRQVSYYHYCYREAQTQPSFDHFVNTDRRARLNNYEIYSIGGTVAVDFIGRYEALEDDLKRVLSKIGVDSDLSLSRAKGSIRRDQRPYREYYTPQTKRLIGEWYGREAALLGYEF
jgi:hypothetical protein